MITLYNLIPLFVALSSLYAFLKLSGIIVRENEQEQKDYEEYIGSNITFKKVASFVMFLVFLLMFIWNII